MTEPLLPVRVPQILGYYADIREEYRLRSIRIAEKLTLEALPRIKGAIEKARIAAGKA